MLPEQTERQHYRYTMHATPAPTGYYMSPGGAAPLQNGVTSFMSFIPTTRWPLSCVHATILFLLGLRRSWRLRPERVDCKDTGAAYRPPHSGTPRLPAATAANALSLPLSYYPRTARLSHVRGCLRSSWSPSWSSRSLTTYFPWSQRLLRSLLSLLEALAAYRYFAMSIMCEFSHL